MTSVPGAGKPNPKTLAAKLLATMDKASPNQGHGFLGVWPNEPNSSEIAAELTSFSFNWEGKFNFNDLKNEKKTRACVSIQALYTWHDTPTGEALNFKGAPIDIPYEIGGLPHNQVQRVEMARDRLAGQLTCILGASMADLAEAETQIKYLFKRTTDAGTALMVKVKLDIEDVPATGKKRARRNKTDFLQEIISGPDSEPVEEGAGEEGAASEE